MSRICKVDGCSKKHFGLGFCTGHHRRFKLYGDPLLGQRAFRGSLISWLQDHIEYEGNGCLAWPFGKRDGGYGACTLNGVPMRASRAMCLLAHGNPPPGKPEAAHSCGNKICVNPNHLRWSSAVQNSADKWGHGTMLIGEDVNGAKLDEASIRKIRSLAGHLTQYEIAENFNVSQPAINAIIHGRTWGHVR